ncbi:MAG: prolipoprotein diacylglyceryl transferase [Ferruginibacter sp.]
MTLLYFDWNIDPVIFHIGDFGIRYYSLMFVVGLSAAYYLLKKHGVFPTRSLDQLTIYVVIGTLAGARLGHCLFYEPVYYLRHPFEIIFPWKGFPGAKNFELTGYQGLASHGAAIGILLSVFIFSQKYRLSFLKIMDILGIVIPLTGACIRIGNFFNSEIIGRPSSLPWAVIFEREDTLPRHPSQLYEAVAYLLIFVIMYYVLYPTIKKRAPGYLFGCFLIFVFTTRFLLEFFKERQEDFEHYMLFDMGQLLSIPLIAVGIVLCILKRSWGKHPE